MDNTMHFLEHGIKIYSYIANVCDDPETLKDTFSRILEINSDIDDYYKNKVLNDKKVLYLREIINKEIQTVAERIKTKSFVEIRK